MIERTIHTETRHIRNPLDGFYGRIVPSCIIYEKAILTENQRLATEFHRLSVPTKLSSLRELEAISNRDGRYGGIRLIYATCKRHNGHCREAGETQ